MAETTIQPGTVQFMCPNCQKYKIQRTVHQKRMAAKYRCPECNFEGPN